MTTSQIAVAESRLRPAFVATLVAVTFAIGIGAGFALSQAMAGRSGVAAAVHVVPLAGNDMSAAAYTAQHATTVRRITATPNDMSASAYVAMHPAAGGYSGSADGDMSAAAYSALHAVGGADMSTAAYTATHDR